MIEAYGSRIHTLRKERRFSLDRLAELSGSSKSYIWELENKNPPRPSAEKLSAIVAALGVTVDYLMDRDAQTLDRAEDIAFFREYSRLPPADRERVRQITKVLAAPLALDAEAKKRRGEMSDDRHSALVKLAATQLGIIHELFRAIERLDPPDDLKAIIGSWRDTISDEETLQYLRDYNATGKIFHERQ